MSLVVKNVTKTFVQGGKQIAVLKNISFTQNIGESISLVGPSGSGKTTLLSLLAGLDKPDEGSININGQSIESFSESELSAFRSKNIGIIFQQFHLVPSLTALENVMLPLEINHVDDAKSQAQDLLKAVGLESRINHYPHQLSGGECQRVAIARAIVAKPKWILADEPSGNLDSQTGILVMDLLFELIEKYKLNLILVTHDLNLAKRCQKIIHLKSGMLQ